MYRGIGSNLGGNVKADRVHSNHSVTKSNRRRGKHNGYTFHASNTGKVRTCTSSRLFTGKSASESGKKKRLSDFLRATSHNEHRKAL
jgi:hypothetical protein